MYRGVLPIVVLTRDARCSMHTTREGQPHVTDGVGHASGLQDPREPLRERWRVEGRDDVNCCERPNPRISEKTGRMFCANCRVFLDIGPQSPKSVPDDPGAAETAKAIERAPVQIPLPEIEEPEVPSGGPA